MSSRVFRKNLSRFKQAVFDKLTPLGAMSNGNEIRIYSNGDKAFKSIWHEIRHANSSIFLETYSLEDDVVGQKTVELLSEAANRGVQVTLIYDHFGSPDTIWSSLTSKLAVVGGNVISFNPIYKWPWNMTTNPFLRNHRKIMVVDETTGFCGGMNVSRHYVSTALGGTGRFRDTHVRVRGPAVRDLLSVVQHTLSHSSAHRMNEFISRKQQPATTLNTSTTSTVDSSLSAATTTTPPPPTTTTTAFTQPCESVATTMRHQRAMLLSAVSSRRSPFSLQTALTDDTTTTIEPTTAAAAAAAAATTTTIEPTTTATTTTTIATASAAAGSTTTESEEVDSSEMKASGVRVQILEQNSLLHKRHIQHAMRLAFRNARS